MKLLILTGMSGAGKSTAFKMLEDLGYYCVDNLPIPLLKSFIDLSEQPSAKEQKLVVGIDIRSGRVLTSFTVGLIRTAAGWQEIQHSLFGC